MFDNDIGSQPKNQIAAKEAIELRILQVISESYTPVGSRVLRQQLLQYGIVLSEATVGRWLSELSQNGTLQGHGRQGRTLTENGKLRLQHLLIQHDSWSHVSDLLQIFKAMNPDHLIDLLNARMLIEPEIARLATLRASEDDLARIADTVNKTTPPALSEESALQETQVQEAIIFAQADSSFHIAVAEASHSPALIAVTRLLKSAEPHFPVVVKVREAMGYRSLTEHQAIASAILDRDEELAYELMYSHIKGILSDIQRYSTRIRE